MVADLRHDEPLGAAAAQGAALRMLYVSDYSLGGTSSPSINERTFVPALERRFGSAARYFLCEGPQEIDLPPERVSFFAAPPRLTRPWQVLRDALRWAREARRLAAEQRARLVILRCGHEPLKAWLLARMLPGRVFAKSVDRYWLHGPFIGIADSVLRRVHRHLSEAFLRRCAGVEAVTEGHRRILVERGIPTQRLFVVPNSVDVGVFAPQGARASIAGIPADAWPLIGFVGSSADVRGGLQVVELVRRLRVDHPRAHGLIAGPEREAGRVRAAIAAAGVAERVHCVDWIPFAALPPVLRRFDLALSYAPDHAIVQGNSSLKIRQSLASGVPVLTHADSNAFIAEHDLGSLVEQDDAAAMEREARRWLQRLEREGDALRRRLHEYACEHLSAERALELRVQHWLRLLEVAP